MVTIIVLGLLIWGIVRALRVFNNWGKANYPDDPADPNYRGPHSW